MPSRIPTIARLQKDFIIENTIKDFKLHKPSKTPSQEIRELFFSWLLGLGLPVLSVLIAVLIKVRFVTIFRDAPFLLFFSPIILSGWVAGLYSGLIATLLGALAATYFFIPQFGTFHMDLKSEITVLIYVVEGIAISYLIAYQRSEKAKAEQVRLSFQLLLENTIDYGIVFFDKRGYITNANEGALHLTGYNQDEIQGKFFSILYIPEDKEKKLHEKEFITALKKGRSTDENYLQKKNGDSFFASGFTTPLWTQTNQLYGFVKLFRDITEVRRQDKEKEDFISIAAHELKNPVSSINLYLQLLQRYYQSHPNKEPQDYLRKASKQLQRLLDLITTLLDVSQIQKGKITLNKEKTNVPDLVTDVIENLQSFQKQHMLIKKGSEKAIAPIDKRKIEEVLINLINNAIKYSPEAKRVIVTVKNKQKEVVVSTTDFGMGMSKDVSTKVFERFYRGNQRQTENIPGLGLGLYISSQIIKAHGGKMSVTSQLGQGSTFFFSLPKKS